MTVFIVLSSEIHFTGVVSGVQANIRIERVYSEPEKAEGYIAESQLHNPKVSYAIERAEVR